MGYVNAIKSGCRACEGLFAKAPFRHTAIPEGFIKAAKAGEVKICPNFLKKDTFEISKSKILTEIEELFLRYAPQDRQISCIEKFRNYAKNEDSITVLESLLEGMKKQNLSEKEMTRRFNKYFNNLIKLQKNNPEEFKTMIDGGFFKLFKEGKISPENFDTNMSNARISRALLSDLQKAAKGEDFVPDLSHKNIAEIIKTIGNGQIYERNGHLFILNNNLEYEINMTKEKYLELFPPILKHVSNQGQLPDCWLVGNFDNLISSESGPAGIYRLFRQAGNDIYIKMPNCEKEILFPNGEFLKSPTNKAMTTVPGFSMLEQAYAVHRGNLYSTNKVTNIKDFKLVVDKLMKCLTGHKTPKNYTNPFLLTNETIDYVLDKGINVYTKTSFKEILKRMFTSRYNIKTMSRIIDEQANNMALHIGIGFKHDTPFEYRELYNMVPNHKLTLKGCIGNDAYISNPWFNWIDKKVNKETLLEYTKHLQVPFIWG